jgi:hypothetical protein
MNTPHLHIPTPCHESWEGMTPLPPGQHGKHCATCNHAVIDVTSMPVAEGRQFLNELTIAVHQDPSRRTCVRAHIAPSGQLVAGRRKLLTHSLAAILACTMAGCVGDGPELVNNQKPVPQQQTQQVPPPGMVAPQPQHPTEAIMGEACVPIMGKFAAPVPAPTKMGAFSPPPANPTPKDAAH